MMNRSEAIYEINLHEGKNILHGKNTHFSNINASKNVWWITIPPEIFSQDDGKISLKISSDKGAYNYMHDTLKKIFNFSKFIMKEIKVI